jgi:membrane carboxypeptidase/penicillin-binding protein
MLFRKIEEIRLSLWLEEEMQARFGSKRRAKEEILARYASFVYMGNGQYGFARAAEYYFGQPLSTLTAGAQITRIMIPAGTPEDKALQAISAEEDAAKRVAMLQEFLQQFASNQQAVAYGSWQLSQQYMEQGDTAKARAACCGKGPSP